MTDKQKATQHIKLYAGPAHPCGYLEEQISVSVFADPSLDFDNGLYSELSRLGFRRSGNHVYRPQCAHCSACWAYRVLVDKFRPSRSQKRILKANQELELYIVPAKVLAKDYQLYEQYINQRHQDGDMYPPSFQQYEEFLFSDWCESLLVKALDPQCQCHAIMALDILDDGLSAVYSFFAPQSPYKSLGKYLILKTIEICATQGLPYCYLGYYIGDCQKMNYKGQYQPAEVYRQNRWQAY